MRTMDIWYAHLDEDELMASIDLADATQQAATGAAPRSSATESDGQAGGAERERRARRTPATACRRCPSSPSWSTASTGSSASRRSWSRLRDLAATYGLSPDEVDADDPRAVPRLPRHPAGRPAAPAGAVRDRRRGPQGRRRRQRRHPGVHRPAPGARRRRTRCSCRSRRPQPRCWRTTCPRAGTGSTASASCRGSG